MKFGIRTPSIKKRIAARTSVKRLVSHSLGVKAPRGMGWVTNPKKAAYNRIYNRTTSGCGSVFIILLLVALLLVLNSPSIRIGFAFAPFAIFLPMVMKPEVTPEPVATATLTPTATSTPTQTPTPPAPKIDITYIYANGSGSNEPDEYVEFKNIGTGEVQLSGWKLSDIANHIYTFPSYLMQPNQICRVYTNQINQAYCGFSYHSGAAIWNNSGDCAYLRNGSGQLMDQYCY